MTANGNNKPMKQATVVRGNETALMIEGLYNGISANLKKLKEEITAELKYSSLQLSSVYQSLHGEKAATESRFAKTADVLTSSINKINATLDERLNRVSDGHFEKITTEISDSLKERAESNKKEILSELSIAVEKCEKTMENLPLELRYGYQQNQMIFESLSDILTDEVIKKVDTIDGKLEMLSKVNDTLVQVEEKISSLGTPIEPDYDVFASKVKEKVVEAILETDEAKEAAQNKQISEINEESLSENIKNKILSEIPAVEETDYDKIVETVGEKTEAVVSAHNKEVLEAVAAIPVAENVDYTRIVEEVSEKVLEKIDEYFVNNKDKFISGEKFDYDRMIYGAAEKVVESLPYTEKVNYDRINEYFTQQAKNLNLKVDEQSISDAVIAKMPVAESVDYDKLSDAVIAKMPVPESVDYDKLSDAVIAKMPVAETIDYDKLSDAIIAKMPVAETIDYDKLSDAVIAKMPVPESVDYDKLSDAVIAKMPVAETIDYDKLSDAVIAKMPVAESVDYDKLSDAVIAKMPEAEKPKVMDYDKLAQLVAEKIVLPDTTSEVVVDEDGIKTIAESVSEKLNIPTTKAEIDYDVLSSALTEKQGTPSYELMLDEESAKMIADAVAEKLKSSVSSIEEKVSPKEETKEEPIEEVVEPVEENITEAPEETEEEEVKEELAATEKSEPFSAETENLDEEDGNELVDGETGLVIRLKRSFAAKLKQSTPEVKSYYSDIKNAFNSYKKLNDTLSWHGSRFNYGRNTVAKIGISGKTLCLYIALDPNDSALKQTVYHQRDVSNQKAYEKIPFMVKIKSGLAAKKAVRLVGILAEKLQASKIENYEPIDYSENFEYASTNQLIEDGLIKVSKEKRIALKFN